MMVGEIFEEMPSDGKVATGFLAENGWGCKSGTFTVSARKIRRNMWSVFVDRYKPLFIRWELSVYSCFLFILFGRLWHLIHGKPVQREGKPD